MRPRLLAAASLYIWTSADSGATWAGRTVGGPVQALDWVSVASNSEGTHLVAAANDGQTGGDIWISEDSGATWVDQTAAGTEEWNAIASDSTGAHLVAVAGGWQKTGDIWTGVAAPATLVGAPGATVQLVCSANNTFSVSAATGSVTAE